MAESEESNRQKARQFTRIAIISSFLLALLWPLGSFIIWTLLGVIVYTVFLRFYYQPIQIINKEQSWRKPEEWGHNTQQKTAQRVDPKNLRLVALIVFIIFFTLSIIILIVTLSAGEGEESAITEQQSILKENPDDFDALTNIGNAFYAEGKYDSAMIYYDRILKVDSKNSSALFNKGLTYFQKQDYQNSIDILKKCISYNPDNADAFVVLGDNYYTLNKFNEAINWYKQGYDKGARSGGLLHVMGYIHDQQNNRSDAILYYKEALQYDSTITDIYSRLAELEPDNAVWYNQKADAYKTQK